MLNLSRWVAVGCVVVCLSVTHEASAQMLEVGAEIFTQNPTPNPPSDSNVNDFVRNPVIFGDPFVPGVHPATNFSHSIDFSTILGAPGDLNGTVNAFAQPLRIGASSTLTLTGPTSSLKFPSSSNSSASWTDRISTGGSSTLYVVPTFRFHGSITLSGAATGTANLTLTNRNFSMGGQTTTTLRTVNSAGVIDEMITGPTISIGPGEIRDITVRLSTSVDTQGIGSGDVDFDDTVTLESVMVFDDPALTMPSVLTGNSLISGGGFIYPGVPVPEPHSVLLVGGGIVFGLCRRRRA